MVLTWQSTSSWVSVVFYLPNNYEAPHAPHHWTHASWIPKWRWRLGHTGLRGRNTQLAQSMTISRSNRKRVGSPWLQFNNCLWWINSSHCYRSRFVKRSNVTNDVFHDWIIAVVSRSPWQRCVWTSTGRQVQVQRRTRTIWNHFKFNEPNATRQIAEDIPSNCLLLNLNCLKGVLLIDASLVCLVEHMWLYNRLLL